MEFRLEDTSPLFRRLVPMLDRVATGFTFTEGPVWRGDDLLFSDIPNSRTVRYRPLPEGPEITTFRHPTGNANGLTLDRQGNLIACEHTTRRVTRVDAQGQRRNARRRLRGQATQFAQRRGRPLGRHDLLHRSAVRLAQRVRGQGAGVQRRLPHRPDGHASTSSPTISSGRMVWRSRPTRRRCTSTTRRGSTSVRSTSVRTGRSRAAASGPSSSRKPDERGVPDGMKVDSEGPRLLHRPGRRLGLRRQRPRRRQDSHARSDREPRLGRRRLADAVSDRPRPACTACGSTSPASPSARADAHGKRSPLEGRECRLVRGRPHRHAAWRDGGRGGLAAGVEQHDLLGERAAVAPLAAAGRAVDQLLAIRGPQPTSTARTGRKTAAGRQNHSRARTTSASDAVCRRPRPPTTPALARPGPARAGPGVCRPGPSKTPPAGPGSGGAARCRRRGRPPGRVRRRRVG